MIEIMAVLSITAGNIWALRQNNLKRLLAYSSIAQVGYVPVGVGLSGTPEGGQSALFYLLTYLFMNLDAFFVVARLEKSLGGGEIDLYQGLLGEAQQPKDEPRILGTLGAPVRRERSLHCRSDERVQERQHKIRPYT